MNYYFSERELSAVFALAGVTSLYSFEIRDRCTDKKELIAVLQDFYTRGLVENDGTSFRLTEPLRSLIVKMAEAKTVLRIDVPDSEVPPGIIYASDADKNEIVVLEHFNESYSSSFRLIRETVSSFVESGIYDELLTKYPSLTSFSSCSFDEKARLDEETAEEKKQICLKVSCIRTQNGDVSETMTLSKRGLFYGIETDGENPESVYFSEEKLKDYLYQYIWRCD